MDKELNLKSIKLSDFSVVLTVVIVFAVLVIPLPGFLIDFLVSTSFALALLIFFISVYVQKPLDFSTFPSILLAVTLFRLSLNVATTRAILLHGSQSPEAAGKMIETFGYFVVGGNYVVGLIVFIILVIINFVVITKGAGRVAEVAARFTLDAMPGKQMSIDADLNAGLIDEKEARRRRDEIARQADFYGAMDGASKFVRGDAIAGLLITAINIIGGIIIGVLQHHMSLSAAASRYTVLTIGDGLVSQLPALTVSTAAGIIITRSSEEANLSTNIVNQLINQYQTLYIAAIVLAIMAFVPGMPTFHLLILAAVLSGIAYSISSTKKKREAEEEVEQAKAEEPEEEITVESIEEAIKVDLLELKIGYGLISFVEEQNGGGLIKRIKLMRKQIATELGVIIPSIRIRDDLNLDRNEYVFLIKGVEVARYSVYPDKFLAMKPGGSKDIEGIPTKEPAFGLDAIWIDAKDKSSAIVKGYTVVDPITVIITHLTELVKSHISEIFTRQDASKLLDSIKGDYPKIIEELTSQLSLGVIHKILKNLLNEGIPVRDMITIAETLSDYAAYTKDPEILTEYVRAALAKHITNKYKDENNTINVITLGSNVDGIINANIKEQGGMTYLDLPPNISEKLLEKTQEAISNAVENGIEPIILTSPKIRRYFKGFIERFFPRVPVISYAEIAEGIQIKSISSIEL
ncbi:flagellar biosynthesis protein FlhA [Hippea maritima]|uniref:Flagellar biosynthesis protein FlhA n=1 Tax=Hippea maritima (strain ATCC 700847 / DSM 10411 / MH2) TaxID=760142 RepID=F2LUW8_HIPMA|nr:flagellar biosynthesis protein FlhA [Hippea maritima]AEA33573.1 flagellar biosynthesis protein FlhA [Hippea maritima DSM 10411]